MELLKMLSGSELVAQIVSFLILLVLMRIFVWKKILKILDDRKERIAGEYKAIEETKLELSKLKNDYADKFNTIENTAKIKIREAVEEGKKITEEMRKKAYEESQDIIEDARDNIKYELAKAKEDLKNQIVDLTIKATEDVIEEKLTEDNDRKLINNFLDKIDDVKWLRK
jgi:F-type H+-transporting ATPase subunit b